MKLNAEHLSVLKEVRERMGRDAEVDNALIDVSYYICSNIQRVLLSRAGVDYGTSFDLDSESQGILDSLCIGIAAALSGYSTFGSYLERALPNYLDMSGKAQDRCSVLGRLAWLDKMLETHEIVAEKLPNGNRK